MPSFWARSKSPPPLAPVWHQGPWASQGHFQPLSAGLCCPVLPNPASLAGLAGAGATDAVQRALPRGHAHCGAAAPVVVAAHGLGVVDLVSWHLDVCLLRSSTFPTCPLHGADGVPLPGLDGAPRCPAGCGHALTDAHTLSACVALAALRQQACCQPAGPCRAMPAAPRRRWLSLCTHRGHRTSHAFLARALLA